MPKRKAPAIFQHDGLNDLIALVFVHIPSLSKQGKSGGTMAHPFIACDFEMWNDAEFRFEVVRFFISSRTEIQNEIE